MKIIFLPTVWSDIIILESNGKFALVDTGGEWQRDMIKKAFSDFGIDSLEFILLTHFHPDHYGCLEMTVKNCKTETVYFKEYSGVTKTDGTGKECDDEARKAESENCMRLRRICEDYSTVIPVEKINSIKFGDIDIRLFNTENAVKNVFEDREYDSFARYICNENQNSIAAFFEYGGRGVLLTGDITDFDLPHPKISRLNTRIAKELGCHIDIYKAPHHGYGVGSPEALSVYTPSYVYFTNTEETVMNNTESVKIIKEASPTADITFASDGGVIFTISEKGEISKKHF